MFWIELLFVLTAIFVGARIGGIGLGIMGGFGLAILTFVFGLQPNDPPIDVMLMIVAVITAASAMQAAGGLDYLVYLAEKILRRHPERITIYGPLVTYVFTFVAGTGHVAYSILPVIAEVARETKVRPERPLGIAVIASQQAITASPISAATVALLGILSAAYPEIQLLDILKISIPATLVGVIVASLLSTRTGKELLDDPEYQRRVNEGLLRDLSSEKEEFVPTKNSKISVSLFLLGTFSVVLFGSFPELRPSWIIDGELVRLSMPKAIEIIMLSTSALIVLLAKANVSKAVNGNVFIAGMQAVIAIFGIAWMGNTFVASNMDFLSASIQGMVEEHVWMFAFALFLMSIILYSQAATVLALMPLGISLGLAPFSLIAMFPAVNGYFFIPNYPTVVAAINFDRTGTTRIGKYVLNHSFMIPGLVATFVAVCTGFLLSTFA